MRPTTPSSVTSLPLPPARWLGPALLLWLLVCLLAAHPLSACVEKNKAAGDKAGIWIDVGDDNTVMIKVRGFMAFPPSPGTDCGCGIQDVPGLANLSSARVMRVNTNEEIEEFNFEKDSGIGSALAGEDASEQGEEWFGFRATDVSPTFSIMPVELVFTGTLEAGTSFEDLRTQLEDAGDVIGFGKIDPSDPGSGLGVCPPTIIDPAPEPQTAPLIKINRMGPEHSVELRVHDVEEGLATVRVLEASDMRETLPDFVPGTTGPVVVGFTMAEGKDLGSIGIEACNTRGECRSWRAEMVVLKTGRRGDVTRTLTAGPAARVLRVHNGVPGAKALTLSSCGQRFLVRPLVAGQTMTLTIPPEPAREDSTVNLWMQAPGPGAEAMVLIAEPE